MKICLVAAPLMARSGVYRSAVDLVTSARHSGLDWSAVLAVRPDAPGEPVDVAGVRESVMRSHGHEVISEIRALVETTRAVAEADVVITMISQSDMAIQSVPSLRQTKHVAWVRGLPWPDRREQALPRRVALRALETRALRRADEVWATTPLLAEQIRGARAARLVPAGIPALPRVHHGHSVDGPLVWAGRFAPDKGLPEFLDLVRATGHRGRVHGSGPLEHTLRPTSPGDVEWAGWAPAARLWDDAAMYVSTSHREAYGRCAVEAASAGLPVLLSNQVGVAPFLYTDPELRSRFVLPLASQGRWAAAVRDLAADPHLRLRVSDHVSANARAMSIEASVASAHARTTALLP